VACFRYAIRGSKNILAEVTNTEKGDAIVFRLAKHLEHRITQVTDTSIKTTFAGWFKGAGSFLHPSEYVGQGDNGGQHPRRAANQFDEVSRSHKHLSKRTPKAPKY
jgi:hypothetical protein